MIICDAVIYTTLHFNIKILIVVNISKLNVYGKSMQKMNTAWSPDDCTTVPKRAAILKYKKL